MDGKADALKTFVEQTKLLVTLASGFIVAPAAAVPLVRSSDKMQSLHLSVRLFFSAEIMLILSVVMGYVVLGTIAGSQHSGEYDVHRTATRVFSLLQLFSYLAGLFCFILLIRP